MTSKHDQQRSGVEARVLLRFADEEFAALVIARHGDKAAQRLHQRILLGSTFCSPITRSRMPLIDQQASEDVENPVKPGDQAHPGANKDAAQEQRAQNTPEQNAMLLLLRDREIIEDHEEDEEIIDAERNFQNIAGDELQRSLVPLPEIQDNREPSRQPNIQGAPIKRLSKPDDVAAAVEDAKIQHQHAEHEQVE